MPESDQEVLVERLRRFPAERYPVQHATTQFHLGAALLNGGEAGPSLAALTVARDTFGRAGMRLEQAKATVMLGVALRAAGRLEEASTAFATAGAELAALDQPAEQGAALYNLGLVLADDGDSEGAHKAWEQSRELFLAGGHLTQAAAAARDHGGSLLRNGQVEQALPLLEHAVAWAERAGDEPGASAAGNSLGLARLAADEPAAAVAALRRALGSVARSVQPADHAMIKANLALAYEQTGELARARLAARQSLAIADGQVRAQAEELLARRPGRDYEDLLVVLDKADRQQWVPVIRDELLRAVDLPVGQRCELFAGFLDGVLLRPAVSYDLTESLLRVVLEFPPAPYELLVSAVVEACARRPETEANRLRAVTGSALARFALPQWHRLAASLNAAADASGQPTRWK